jgi:ABC-type phosphate/phosphonate transport system substrate-binding protein
MTIGFKCTTPCAALGIALVSAVLAANAQAQAVQAAPPTAPAALQVLVNPGDTGEQSRVAQYGVWKLALEQALRRERITNVNVRLSNDATADLGMTRAKSQGIFIAPAHVIGSAVRYGYTPVLGLDKPVQAVLVAPRDSGIDSLAKAAGKRLGMPLQDSVVTYLLRGEVNAANTTIKRHFGTVYNTRYQEALLPCLQIRLCDVVVVERAVYERWVAAGEKFKVVLESKPVPGLGVAIRDDVRPGAEALRAALTEALAGGPTGRNEVGPVQAEQPLPVALGSARLVVDAGALREHEAVLGAGYHSMRCGAPPALQRGLQLLDVGRRRPLVDLGAGEVALAAHLRATGAASRPRRWPCWRRGSTRCRRSRSGKAAAAHTTKGPLMQ